MAVIRKPKSANPAAHRVTAAAASQESARRPATKPGTIAARAARPSASPTRPVDGELQQLVVGMRRGLPRGVGEVDLQNWAATDQRVFRNPRHARNPQCRTRVGR
jgi:hypothetical protein